MITRYLTFVVCVSFLMMALATGAVGNHLQQSIAGVTGPGVGLPQQEKTDDTLASLKAALKRDKNNLTAWHHLGLALEQKGDANEARKAHEKAANLGDKLLADHLDDVTSNGDLIQKLAPLRGNLVEAWTSAEKYIKLGKLSGKKLQEWRLRADSLSAFAEIASAPPGTPAILGGKEVSVKARVLSKPEPQYTEEARRSKITGTIVVRAIFAANGKVIGVRVVRGLAGGLTEQAIIAARKIKFIPAFKDGRPVSMFIQLEYSFNLY